MRGHSTATRGNMCPNFAYRTSQMYDCAYNGDPYPMNMAIITNNTGWEFSTAENRPPYGKYRVLSSFMNYNYGLGTGSMENYGSSLFEYKTRSIFGYPSWTIEWMQYSKSTTNAQRMIVSIGSKVVNDIANYHYYLSETTSGTYEICFTTNTASFTHYALSSTVSVNRNQWDYMAITMYNGYFHLFVNGSEVANLAVSTLPNFGTFFYVPSSYFQNNFYVESPLYQGSVVWGYYSTPKICFEGLLTYQRLSNFARYTQSTYTLPTYNWYGLEAR